jgi:hypothetical protein
MIKEIEIAIPTSYADIPLRRWLDLQKEVDNYKDNEEAIGAITIQYLCGLDPKYLQALPADAYKTIRDELNSFIGNVELPLKKFITIAGVEYGIEPNLSKISYGAYADISKYDVITMDTNWAKIMNILYRPVTKKAGDMYSIKRYEGNDEWEKWLDVGMDTHFGSLFFFLDLQINLFSSILNSLKVEDLHPNIKQILARNGAPMQQLLNLQKMTSYDLIK